MSTRAQENLVAVVVLALFVGVIYLSMDYGPRARMVPLPVSVIGVILVLVQIVWQNLRSTDELQVDWLKLIAKRSQDEIAPEREAKPREETPHAESDAAKRERLACLLVLAFLALILALGPIAAMAVFTFVYFVRSGHYRWVRAAIYTALATGAVYALFVVALDIQLYHGVLEPLFNG